MSFIYNMADTWNAGGTTFNAIYMNISNGAGGAPVGAAASRAFRLDANLLTIFEIDITGITKVYGTFTDSSNYERLAITGNAGVNFQIDVQRAGTGSTGLDIQINSGTNGGVKLGNAGSTRWTVDGSSGGHFFAATDNVNDIGATAASRPRNLFIAGYKKGFVGTVASLPTAASAGAGAEMMVTNSSSIVFTTTVTGSGGTTPCPVYSDGTQWRVG